MAKPQPGVWGIDLGQCALKALRVQEVDGQIVATAFDYVEYPKILSQPDADPDQLIREALNTFLSRNTLRGDSVAISVPGQSGLARFVKLPPVEEKKIADIVRFEAKQQIPFNLDEVVWDYQKIGASNVVDGFALETEIGLFAMKRDMVNRYLQHFKDVGVDVHIIQMAPLALCNFIAYDLLGTAPGQAPAEGEAKKGCVVALDIGADSSNLVITDANRVIWQRPIPLGGNHFTRALTKDLKLTFAKAEHLKRNATKSPDLKKILGALKPVLNDFVGEVQRSLGYFTNTHRDAQIDYMVGLGNAFRLPGLQRFLAEKLQLDVRKLAKMERLGGEAVLSSPVYTENILSFSVAYGLALQGIKQGRVATNLLPGEIRMERLVKAKKPWAVAAAGVLLVALAGAALGSYLDQRPYLSKSVSDAVSAAESAAKRANEQAAKVEAAKKRAKREEEDYKAIVAGQSERLNWAALLKYITECIPQPDGKNLPEGEVSSLGEHKGKKARELYWDNPAKDRRIPGKKAFEEYEEYYKPKTSVTKSKGKKKDGAPVGAPHPAETEQEQATLPPFIDDLIQFRIAAIDARYCDDLKSFWSEVRKKIGNEPEYVRPMKHHSESPEGKGWVIELRGYTFHAEKEIFIRHTLLNSLAEKAKSDEALLTDPSAAPGKGKAPAATDKGKTPAPPVKGKTPAPPVKGKTPKGKVAPPPEPDGLPKNADEAVRTIIGRHVSHVVLYAHKSFPTDVAGQFEVIKDSSLDALVRAAAPVEAEKGPPAGVQPGKAGPAAPAPGGKGGPVPEAPTGPSREGWKSLNTRTAGGQAPVGGKHHRTEFIILFVWREWTPSDALRSGGSAPATPGPTGPARPAGTGQPGNPGKR
jgi:type IV pilus assembly protein PilM